MNLLITAGNTQAPIDRVRCLTNIFTGRTGTAIALTAEALGHHVTLLTSRPEAVSELQPNKPAPRNWGMQCYRTFDELEAMMAKELRECNPDVVIHSAAVSDYLAAGVYAPTLGTQFSSTDKIWNGNPPALLDRQAEKVKSDEPELWLRLVQAPKLVDKMRGQWSFRGVLVKFKLEVGASDEQLLQIAERSRLQSDADLMVANTLEGASEWAYLGPQVGRYERIARAELPRKLLAAVEQKHKERTHG